MKNEYLINEIAKMFNLTKRTLQYYDKIDLLKPDFIKENGYRVYNEDQLAKLIEILIWKNIGLNSRDIKSILEEKTEQNIGNILNEVDERLEDELKKIMFLKENLKSIKKSLDYKNLSHDKIMLKTLRKRKIIKIKDSGENINNIVEVMALGTKILRETIEKQLPFIEFGVIFSNDSEKNNNYTNYSDYFFTLPEDSQCDNTLNLSSKSYACLWFEGDFRSLDKEIIKLLHWIDVNDYVIDGEILYSESFSSLYYDAIYETNGELQIPVLKKQRDVASR